MEKWVRLLLHSLLFSRSSFHHLIPLFKLSSFPSQSPHDLSPRTWRALQRWYSNSGTNAATTQYSFGLKEINCSLDQREISPAYRPSTATVSSNQISLSVWAEAFIQPTKSFFFTARQPHSLPHKLLKPLQPFSSSLPSRNINFL